MPIRVLLSFFLGAFSALAPAASATWVPWIHLPAVFDLAGPRRDGQLVAAAGGRLFLITSAGAVTPFADGTDGYHSTSGPESYLALSPGLHVSGAGCDFPPDSLYVLRPQAPLGITRVDAEGRASSFASISGLDSLNGIAFDTVGRFDHRLLVTGPAHQHSTVLAIDCKGGILTVTESAPPLEGGLSVAPAHFGSFAGDLVAPDENSGAMLAISASGRSSVMTNSGIQHGGDIGVESAAFVPAGFTQGGRALVADRATANNPHPGTDSILSLSSAVLAAAGVRDGDLLVSAEGGAVTIDVRCQASCSVRTIVPNGTTAHIEGHLLLIPDQLPATPGTLPAVSDIGSQRTQLLLRLGGFLLVVATLAALGTTVIRRRRTS